MIPNIANRLLQEGYTPAAVAGVLGNVMQESGGNPNAVGDNGQSFGLFQHSRDRAVALKQFAQQLGKSPTDPEVQTEFTIHELKTQYPQLDTELRGSSDPARAAIAFGKSFERPNEQAANWQQRVNYANQFHGVLNGKGQEGQAGSEGQTNAYGQGNGQEALLGSSAQDKVRQGGRVNFNDILDQQHKTVIKNLYEQGKTNDALAADLIEHMLKQTADGGEWVIPGMSAAQSAKVLQVIRDNPPNSAVPEKNQGQYALYNDVIKAVLNDKGEATGIDIALNLARQTIGLGASPEIAGNVVGAIASSPSISAPTGVIVPSENPQDAAAIKASSSAAGEQVTQRLEQARSRMPAGVDLGMGIAGGLPAAGATKYPIVSGGLIGLLQGLLSSEKTDPQSLMQSGLTGTAFGTGIGTLGALVGRGTAELATLSNTSRAENEASGILADTYARGFGTSGNTQESIRAFENVAKKFTSRSDIPTVGQGAIGEKFSTVSPLLGESRFLSKILRDTGVTPDAPAFRTIVDNFREVFDVGSKTRFSKMLEDVVGPGSRFASDTTPGKILADILPDMQKEYLKALDEVKTLTPNLHPEVFKQMQSMLGQSKAYQKAVAELRDPSVMRDAPWKGTAEDSTAFQDAVRKRLSEWNRKPGGEFEGQLGSELSAMRQYLTKGTEINQALGGEPISIWGKANALYAEKNDIARALDAGKAFSAQYPEQLTKFMTDPNVSLAEKKAFTIGAIDEVRTAYNKANYKVNAGFSNVDLNEKVQAVLNSPEKFNKFLMWLGEEMQLTKAYQKAGLDRGVQITDEGMSYLGRIGRDAVFTSAVARGSGLFAAARASGELLQSAFTGKPIAPETRRLLAAYLTSTNPEVQQQMVSQVRAQYIRDYWRDVIKQTFTGASSAATAATTRSEMAPE